MKKLKYFFSGLLALSACSSIAATKTDLSVISATVANTFSATDNKPSTVTITKNGRNFLLSVAGGGRCPSGAVVLESQGCLSIVTNSRGSFTVPIFYSPQNSLTFTKNSGNGTTTDQIGDQVSRVVVSLTPLNGGSASGSVTLTQNITTGSISVTLPQVKGITTLNYSVSYRFEPNSGNGKNAPQPGVYSGVWPIRIGTVTIVP